MMDTGCADHSTSFIPGATEPENTLVQKIGEGFIALEESRQDTGDAKQVNAVPTPKRPGKGLKKHNPAGMRVGR